MKGRPAIIIFFLVLFGAAILYFFLSTDHSEGLMVEGVVDANQVVVSPKIQGILERLAVDEGSRVRAGELIARLDSAELDADVEVTVPGLRICARNWPSPRPTISSH